MKYFYQIFFGIGIVATLYYNGLNDPKAKMVAMGCFGLLFIIALFSQEKKNSKLDIFNKWLIWLLLLTAVNMLYNIVFDAWVSWNTSLEQAMPLMVAFSSYYLLDVKKEKLAFYFLPICALSALIAVRSVINGLGGFVVAEYYDADIAKNQIGAAFTTVAIICAVFFFDKYDSKLIKPVYAILSVVNTYPALYFTCRTALLCYGACLLFLLYREYGYKSLIFIPVLVYVIAWGGGENLQDLLYNSIVGRRDVNNMDDLTSGRVTNAIESILFFIEHPIFGCLGSMLPDNKLPGVAHIFILYRLSIWGIFGAIPALALYFSIFKIFVNGIKRKHLLLSGVLFVAFVESFGEYSPPFGPGSCFIITFVIIGLFLRYDNNIECPNPYERNDFD